jgi:hypothetical protein
MTTATPVYGSATAMTMTLASLASSTSDAGRESTAVDNKDTDDAIDCLVGGKVTTGTSPVATRQIEVWLYGSYNDTDFSGGASGTDAALTPDFKGLLRLLVIIPTSATSDKAYRWGPYSVAQAFGGTMPVRWGVWITQNTNVNLNATAGNHEVVYIPVKYESA